MDLVTGKYKLLEIGAHTSKLVYGKNTLEIWIANGVSYCKIHSKVKGFEFPEFDADVKALVFNLATTRTKYMTKARLKKALKAKKNFI